MPKMLHNLRSSYCGENPILHEFDKLLRDCLCQILNVAINDNQWIQASLPVKNGGLGIRSARQIAPSAYLASASGTASLVSAILPIRLQGIPDPCIEHAYTNWFALCGSTPPIGAEVNIQREWDKVVISYVYDQLLVAAPYDYTRARLLALSSPHAGDWLNALPISAVGLRMSNEAIMRPSYLPL